MTSKIFSQDGESGWSSLHRALHFGHLAVASVLLQSGASLTLEDSKCRIPVDLLSGPVSQAVGNELDSGNFFFAQSETFGNSIINSMYWLSPLVPINL